MDNERQNYDRDDGSKDYSDLSDSNRESLSSSDKNYWNKASDIRGDDYDPSRLSEAENSTNRNSLDDQDLGKSEQKATENSPWDNQTGGGSHKSRNESAAAKSIGAKAGKLAAKMKGKGPMVAILGGLGGGGILIAVVSFALVSLLPIFVAETFRSGFANMRNSMTTRGVNNVVSNKISGSDDSGCDESLSVSCKFKTASDTTIEKLESSGIGVNTSGAAAYNDRNNVQSLEVNGQAISSPSDLQSALVSDPSLRSDLDSSFKTRLMVFGDSRWNALSMFFGLSKNPFAGLRSVAAITNRIIGSANDTTDSLRSRGIWSSDTSLGENTTLGGSLDMFNSVNDAAQLYCAATALGRAAAMGIKAARIAGLSKFAFDFLSLADKMKAGDATAEEVQYMGESLTEVSSLVQHVENDSGSADLQEIEGTSGSAMDSQNFKWYAYNDSPGYLDSSASNFSIGMGPFAILSTITDVIGGNLNISKNLCGFVQSMAWDWIRTAIIDLPAAIASLGTSFAWTIGRGIAAGIAIEIVKEKVFGWVEGKVIPEDISGQDYGNALSSGAGAIMSENAQAGGGSALTKDGAVAYYRDTQEVLAMQAEEDRLNLSPFDPTSKNTFLGSLAYSAIPLATSSGILPTINSIGTIFRRSFASIMPGASALDDAKFRIGMDHCDDEFYEENGIAAGPDCVIYRGVDVNTLNASPDNILDTLIESGDIRANLPNENSSIEDAIISGSSLARYREYCAERRVPIGDDTEDGGGVWGAIFGLGTTNDWTTGKNCLYNPNGNEEQQMVNYYSSFINLAAADEMLDQDPDEANTAFEFNFDQQIATTEPYQGYVNTASKNVNKAITSDILQEKSDNLEDYQESENSVEISNNLATNLENNSDIAAVNFSKYNFLNPRQKINLTEISGS